MYYSLCFNLFVWFLLDMEFKKVKKTFESCGLNMSCGKLD